jgi:hypothetical protein
MTEFYEYRVRALFGIDSETDAQGEFVSEVKTDWLFRRRKAIEIAQSMRETESGNVTVETRIRGDFAELDKVPAELGDHSDPHPHAGGGSR